MLRTLRIYPALLHAYWQRALVYRATYLVVLVNAAFPLVMMSIWIGLAQGGAIQGYGAVDFAAYYLVAILVRRITGCGIVREIELLVRNGDLSVYLLRPLNPVHYFVARILTARLVIIPIVAAPVIFGMLVTPGIWLNLAPLNLALFAAACAVGLAFEFTAQYALGGLSFWMTQAHGVSAAFTLAESFLGGYIVPLALFPAALQIGLQALPFQGGVALPVEIMTGRVTPEAAVARILVCAAWVVAIAFGARLIWRAGVRSFSAVGA
ncbi:MAG: ABC-2 family transporter protein [Chloroflexi bacterium]|nr:ABC-2 family transporter protein [Chloroflexota bacterium]